MNPAGEPSTAESQIKYSEELVHNNENLNETIGPRAGIRINVTEVERRASLLALPRCSNVIENKERFILCIESPARP